MDWSDLTVTVNSNKNRYSTFVTLRKLVLNLVLVRIK